MQTHTDSEILLNIWWLLNGAWWIGWTLNFLYNGNKIYKKTELLNLVDQGFKQKLKLINSKIHSVIYIDSQQ